MKHIFIINPAAGKGAAEKIYMPMIEKIAEIGEIDHEIHLSQPEGETIRFVNEYCKTHGPEKPLRFYACGGDGTLNEVSSGAFGHAHAQVTVIPGGTGNDFVRNFTNPEYFGHIERQIRGEAMWIDVLGFETEGKQIIKSLAVNMGNIGADSETAYRMQNFKKYPFVAGTAAYVLSLASVLIGRLGIKMKAVFDGEEEVEGEYLLMAAGNGICCGGGFHAAPHALPDDGLMDVCLVRCIPKIKLGPMILKYKNGQHLESAEMAKYIMYKQCRSLSIEGEKPLRLCIDGEVYTVDKVSFEVKPRSLLFSAPAGCHFRKTAKTCEKS